MGRRGRKSVPRGWSNWRCVRVFAPIDTANQRRHYFEAGVGEGLAAAYRAGVVKRADLFLQTKFTYRPGQDHRLPL